jgi:predicted hydrocarbon binding protein
MLAEDIIKKRRTLQETMNFMTAMSAGIEIMVGRGANGMAMSAGRDLGRMFSENAERTDDLLLAVEEVKRVLSDNNCLWEFEPFKNENQEDMITVHDNGSLEMSLVFRNCMIRQSLFRFGHPQKGSLCFMMYGFFSGAIGSIMGKKATLEIIHAGQNACLKRLTVQGINDDNDK